MTISQWQPGRHPAHRFFNRRTQCHGTHYPMPGLHGLGLWLLFMVPWLAVCIALSTGGVP